MREDEGGSKPLSSYFKLCLLATPTWVSMETEAETGPAAAKNPFTL